MSEGTILVLYAEDDENDAFLMERAFRRAGLTHRLRLVPNGQEALDYIFGRGPFADRSLHPAPALVLLDLKMPQVSGLEVLQQLQAAADSAPPVVVLSSSTQPLDIQKAGELGAAAYLVKPSSGNNLFEMLKNLDDAFLRKGAAPGIVVAGNRLGMM